VLVGALAASRRARIYDSVILKLLGATAPASSPRRRLEFTGLALIVSACRLRARRRFRLVCRG
jgi:putative ABC transport system permease protein